MKKTNTTTNSISKLPIERTLRYKILFIVLPLFLISFTFFGITVYFSTNKSITNIAKEFIGYRLKEISDYSQNLAHTDTSSTDSINSMVMTYAQKFTDEIFIIIPYKHDTNNIETKTYTLNTNILISDINALYNIMYEQDQKMDTDPDSYNSWIEIITPLSGDHVGIFIPNTITQSWFILLASREHFYAPISEIMSYIVAIVIVSLIILTILTLFFVNFITEPLTYCLATIKSITDNMDFSKRVRILYPDEIGILGQYFNDMIQELEKSYNQIKNYAYQTVLAKQKEERIRFIFQKYVPSDVIDHVLNRATDTMLIGTKQYVSILFSDIRSFTTISEQLSPEELVISLNTYFTSMVEQIISNKGIVDKFIGDAIMAIFGAPAQSKTSADDSLKAALLMLQHLEVFNQNQTKLGKINFEIGIGINTGDVIVGNIGSEQKLDYTVIGDAVNLGSRLEGLTKSYKQPLLISEFTKDSLVDATPYLFVNIDVVRVKGKTAPIAIYAPLIKKLLTQDDTLLYQKYHFAQQYYYQGDFQRALSLFREIDSNELYLIHMYIERCEHLIKNPPKDWDGVETWKTK